MRVVILIYKLLVFILISLFLLAGVGQAAGRYTEEWQAILQKQEERIADKGEIIGNFEVGVAYANTGKIEEAIAVFNQIPKDKDEAKDVLLGYQEQLQKDPEDIFLLNYTAFGFFVLNRYANSSTYFKEALSRDEDNPWLMNFYALTLAYQKEFARAHQLIEKSLKIKEDDYTYIFKAIILYEEGNKWAALKNVFRNPTKAFALMKHFQ